MLISLLQTLFGKLLIGLSIGLSVLLDLLLAFELSTIEYHYWCDIIFDEHIDFIDKLSHNFLEPLTFRQILRAQYCGFVEPAIPVYGPFLVAVMP